LLSLTLALLAELACPPRSRRLAPELARSAGLALIPAALCGAYFLRSPRWLETLVAPVRSHLVLPLPISAGFMSAALCFLVALRFRTWREPAAEGERWPRACQRRRAWAAALLAALTAAAGFAWDLRRERAHERACVLALAQLGGYNATSNLVSFAALREGGRRRLRRLLAHPPPGPYDDPFGRAGLRTLIAEGELALEFTLGALPGHYTRPPQEVIDYLRRYDPDARRLAARLDADERPASLLPTVLEFQLELLAQWGRRGMIERLLAIAEDPAFGTHAGFEDALALAVDLCGAAGAPRLGAPPPSALAYHSWRRESLRAVRDWVHAQELSPRWWVRLRMRGSPPPQPSPRRMELRVRFVGGGSRHIQGIGYFGSSGRHGFDRRPSSLEVLADDQLLWLVPCDLPPDSSALSVELRWGEQAELQRWAVPAR